MKGQTMHSKSVHEHDMPESPILLATFGRAEGGASDEIIVRQYHADGSFSILRPEKSKPLPVQFLHSVPFTPRNPNANIRQAYPRGRW